MADRAYDVEPLGESTGHCACCGKVTRTVWGIVHHAGAETVASYFMTWTVGADLADHPAQFDMIMGAWGEGTGAADRVAVSMQYARPNAAVDGRPAVMVVDAAARKIAKNPLVGAALSRDEVIGSSLATTVFDIFDAVFLQDGRVAL